MNAELASSSQPSEARKYPVLDRPPIAEVVCGFGFESVAGLDLAEFGVYWDTRASAFPTKDIQPTLFDEPTIQLGAGALPARLRLTSVDQSRILQLQHDRFFMNWKTTGDGYPSFSGRDGKSGLGDEAALEFAMFAKFVQERLKTAIQAELKWVELAKVDHLVRGTDWADWADLAKLLPLTGTFQSVHRSDARELNLRFTEHAENDRLVIALTTGNVGGEPAVRLESRIRMPVVPAETPRQSMNRANAMINDVFFKLVDSKELHRFGVKGG
jgi:hypothetical protein